MAIVRPSKALIENEICPRLIINNQGSGLDSQFVLNSVQKDLLELFENDKRFTMVLKARKMGVSTISILYAVVYAIINPNVRVGLFCDNFDKAIDSLTLAKSFIDGLEYPAPLASSLKKLTLQNKSIIEAVSADGKSKNGESRVARSKTYHLIILSEFAFYPQDEGVFSAVMAALNPKVGQAIIESTASQDDNKFKKLWTEPNDWQKYFCSFERESTYVLDEDTITDDEYKTAKEKLGFTSRRHAAFWISAFRNVYGGDENRTLREYPILPEQAWQNASSRWIVTMPTVLEHQSLFSAKIFEEPKKEKNYIFGVDTALAKGKDSSCIIVIDHNGNIAATYYSNKVEYDEFVKYIKLLSDFYKPIFVVIEENTVGEATVQMAKDAGVHSIKRFFQTEPTKLQCLTSAKRAIENGACAGEELLEECKSIHRDRHNAFKGKKDMLMSLGMALQFTGRAQPNVKKYVDPNIFNPKDFLTKNGVRY